MADSAREVVITRVAFLELQDEQRLVKEGYELLDEKRILLAAEIRRELGSLRRLSCESSRLEQAALGNLRAALRLHGLDELSVYPALSMADGRLEVIRQSRLFGLELIGTRVRSMDPKEIVSPVNPTPEAARCALAYRQWLSVSIELAACHFNLRRLIHEYIRTERRARAIESVLLPEIESALKLMDEQLESQDQEEVARLHRRRDANTAPNPAS